MSANIQVRGLAVRFGKREVLRGLDLDLEQGSVTALLARNGAGKTTLLRTLAGEIPHAKGDISVLGIDPRKKPIEVRRKAGWMPDSAVLPNWMRVRDLFAFLEPFHPTWDQAEVQRLIQLFEVDPKAKLKDLSRGQFALARLTCTLAHKPQLLLLDEPFSGLDAVARGRVFDGVLDHVIRDGRSVLVASHSFADVERCCDRLALLYQGRILLDTEMEELRRETVRLTVSLKAETSNWNPPTHCHIEQRNTHELTLFSPSNSDSTIAQLQADPAVQQVAVEAWDFERIVSSSLQHRSAA